MKNNFANSALLVALFSGAALSALPTPSKDAPVVTSAVSNMQKPYQAKNYVHLLGMKGFNDTLLNNHFKLYEGYVKQTNLLQDDLAKLTQEGKDRSPIYAGIKHMFGWEFDGMRLHEYYFGNLGGNGELDNQTPLYQRLTEQFGSYDNWKKDFVATGAMRGIGWAILYEDPRTGHLFNMWINEHDVGHLAGGKPLLVLDVFEHAYMTQYGLDRAQYIDAFFANIDWKTVTRRQEASVAQP
jgi:Fe-Mn family superoxide dismutase